MNIYYLCNYYAIYFFPLAFKKSFREQFPKTTKQLKTFTLKYNHKNLLA